MKTVTKIGTIICLMLVFSISINAQILVVPDVHGRSFWKYVKSTELPVIFLGDYLDPYSKEGISQEEALSNFKEILEFKRLNPNRVTLLIGNHEIHYLDTFYNFSRKDTLNAEYIHDLIHSNLQMFSLAAHADLGGKSFLFTHAGIHESWWTKHFKQVPKEASIICDTLNAYIENKDKLGNFIDNALMELTKARGGEDKAGSCVWADLDEYDKNTDYPKNIYQVFGHTKLKKKASIKKHFADLDCRKIFIITEKGKIKEY
ncbi:MAG: hypothetical protein EOM31_13820 [Bacteroidia bacterium]|jgi:hypothetical protein|nr:metallophosphoesterase [Prevotella sp.]MBP8687696.1 metallophosphoesterase [Prevotella sp.]NCC11541.1 hypothetical protein [Bacteroidia bacterium]